MAARSQRQARSHPVRLPCKSTEPSFAWAPTLEAACLQAACEPLVAPPTCETVPSEFGMCSFAQADDWIVYSMSHRCELARVRCGGWRRQYAGLCTSPTDFTFAYYRDRKIHIQRRHQPEFEPATAGATCCLALSILLRAFKLHDCRVSFPSVNERSLWVVVAVWAQ